MVEKSFSSEYLLKKVFVEFCSLENFLFHIAENCNKVIVSKLCSGERDVMKHFIKKKLCEEFQYGQSAKRCLVAESGKINLFGLAIKIYLCLNRHCEYYFQNAESLSQYVFNFFNMQIQLTFRLDRVLKNFLMQCSLHVDWPLNVLDSLAKTFILYLIRSVSPSPLASE